MHFAERPKGEIKPPGRGIPLKNDPPKRPNFVSADGKAKSAVVARFVRIARQQRLDYNGFLYVCQQARRKLGLRKAKKERRLPQLLSEADLKRFLSLIHI